MNIVAAIIAGLVATAAMTLLMYMAPMMGMPKMDIIGMMGTMFMEKGTGAYILGTIIHFMMGAIFAIIYAWVWTNWFGDPIWLWGLIFGAIHGVIAIIVMPMIHRHAHDDEDAPTATGDGDGPDAHDGDDDRSLGLRAGGCFDLWCNGLSVCCKA